MTRLIPATVLLLMSTGAWAQGCGPYDEAQRYLEEKHGEAPVGRGIVNGALLELWLNPETGSWTILARPRPEVACPLSGGSDWEFAMPAPQGRPS